MLDIRDLKLLKITKVKDWAIHFTYDGTRYLLHGNSEWSESVVDLFKVDLNKFGNYKLTRLKRNSESDYLISTYIKFHKVGLTYSHIDKEFFVRMLTLNDFIVSLYSDDINKRKERVLEYNKEIAKLRNEISKVNEKIAKELKFN